MPAKAITLKAFAELQGWRPSYVTKLKKSGRLVFSQAGRVKVRESLELIAQTAGSRSDVATRHQDARQAKTPHASVATDSSEASQHQPQEKNAPDAEASTLMTLKDAQHIKAFAESRRVAALADREEMERDRLAGDLIAREDVDAAMKFIGATVRGLMEVFPDQTAPLVAPAADLEECHALLLDQCRNVLINLGDAIERQRVALDGGGA